MAMQTGLKIWSLKSLSDGAMHLYYFLKYPSMKSIRLTHTKEPYKTVIYLIVANEISYRPQNVVTVQDYSTLMKSSENTRKDLLPTYLVVSSMSKLTILWKACRSRNQKNSYTNQQLTWVKWERLAMKLFSSTTKKNITQTYPQTIQYRSSFNRG
jgi:hypothetical protein